MTEKGQNKPYFLITIDTEGDNLWTHPTEIKTENARFLPRFQELCEKYALIPTYLCNYEMANSDFFLEFARDCLNRNTCEIGMHLHAWNNPPLYELTSNDFEFHPYLIEYPENIIEEKIKFITDLLEERFATKMVSHRAGRWSFNSVYAKLLDKYAYQVDCSVTPLVSWENFQGNPQGKGGSNYYHFPNFPYLMNLDKIDKPGNSSLLEIPVSILAKSPLIRKLTPEPLSRIFPFRPVLNRLSPVYWLRPNGRNLPEMLWIIEQALKNNQQVVEFMIHSSEFMPAGSPYFPDSKSIDELYNHLEILFDKVHQHFSGSSLKDFYRQFIQQN